MSKDDRKQSRYLRKQILPAIRKRCLELGLKLDPASPRQVSLQHLQAPGGVDASKSTGGLILVVEKFNKTDGSVEKLSYMRNYKEDARSTARNILWIYTLHAKKSYAAVKMDGRWFVKQAQHTLWHLKAGRMLADPSGKLFTVADGAGEQLNDGLALVDTKVEPCAGAVPCRLISPGLDKLPPLRGWKELPVRVLGNLPTDMRLYVSGYEARRRNDNSWQYWGQPDGSANFTVVTEGLAVYRARLSAAGKAVPLITLPSAPVAKR